MSERILQSRIQAVLPGIHSYMIYGKALSSDLTVHLEMLFDKPLIIEDIVLKTILDGGSSISGGPLKLIYPTSSNEMIIDASVSDFVLNQSNDTRHLWYTLPAWTKLRWSPYNQYSADVVIAMTVTGRA